MSEFDLIQRYFTRATPRAVLGVGDDAALIRLASGMELAVSTDMLVNDTHFFLGADPYLLGHKTLAVNLSDLAAMGAQPRWATLALSLPEMDENWLKQFSAGFFTLAAQHGVELIGGDTTRGPLNLCVTIMGEVPQGKALRRSGARIGDDIWVSGQVGTAALALAHLQGRVQLSEAEFSSCVLALHQPWPRVALGLALRDVAHSAIDISDGLLADLRHILEQSRVGAEIQFEDVPVSEAFRCPSLSAADGMGGGDRSVEGNLLLHCALSGGDDYELCFTAPVEQRGKVESLSKGLNLPLTRIGAIVPSSACIVRNADGHIINFEGAGYDHFR